MPTSDTIHLLSELALQSYHKRIHPDLYAVSAANIITAAAAAKFSPESADVAAFVAVSIMNDLSLYAVKQAVLTMETHDAMKNYHTKLGALPDTKIKTPVFDVLVEKLEKISFAQEATGIYDSTFDPSSSANYGLAVHAACAIYTHAYACSRAAYTYATALAARYPVGEKRNAVFKDAIIARLSADLLHEPIEPSFFIKMMCSDAVKVLGALLLISGLVVLSIGVCGLAIASVGSMILAASGLSSALITTTGAVMATSSACLFVGRFFAVKQWQHDNDKSAEAVNAMHDVDYESAPQLS